MSRAASTAATRFRLFSGPADEPRARRASDVIALVLTSFGLLAFGAATDPVSRIESALVALVALFPQFLDSVWFLLYRLPWLAAAVIMLAAGLRRRSHLVRDVVVAAAVAFLLVLTGGRLVEGTWLDIQEFLRAGPWSFPAGPLAVPGAVMITASPHLALPLRRAGRRLLWLAAAASVISLAATPSRSIAGVLVAFASAAAVHLVFGSVRGRPGLDDVTAALGELGVAVRSVGIADRQGAGEFVVDAEDSAGRRLIVKMYGRDAHDTQLLSTAWRTAWYREVGSPPLLGRLHQVEHEALLTLLAAQVGLPTDEVVTAGASSSGDALLVLRRRGRRVTTESDRAWDNDLMAEMWRALGRLHRAGIVHGQVDEQHLLTAAGTSNPGVGHEVGFSDFRAGGVTTDPLRVRHDQAQLLVATVLGGDEAEAVRVAVDALGSEAFIAMLPLVQSPVLTRAQRRALRGADLELDEFRQRAADSIGTPAPDLVKLRRVTWGSLLQTGLLVFAFLALARVAGGIDLAALAEEVADANWWLVAIGFVLAQVPRVAHAVSALGASPVPVALGPLYALQLATAYLGLVIPSSAGRIALNVRFFQRQGLQRGTAVAVGALDGFSGFLVQVMVLAGLLTFTSATLDLDLDLSLSSGVGRMLGWIVGLAIVGGAVLLSVPGWRQTILDRAREVWAEARHAFAGLGSPRRLVMLGGGNFGSDLFLALALGVFVRSLGYSIGLGELLVIIISVSLLAGVVPVPGGIGVTEGGLIFGLVTAGLPDEIAFASVIVFRVASFYLPPVWGFFAMKWLDRNDYI